MRLNLIHLKIKGAVGYTMPPIFKSILEMIGTAYHFKFNFLNFVLPLIYQLPNESVKFYEYPTSLIKEVPIEHDHYPKLRKLNLNIYQPLKGAVGYTMPPIFKSILEMIGTAYHFKFNY
jgi:nitric oxide synthase oxygenase domain/subunit